MKGVTLKRVTCKICNQLVDPRGFYSHSKKHEKVKVESNGLVKSERDIIWIPIDREILEDLIINKLTELRKEKI